MARAALEPGADDAAAAPGSRTPATIPRRLGCLVYEMLLLAALVLVAGFLLAPLVSPLTGAGRALQTPDAVGRVLSFAGVFGVAMLYCVGSWTGGRRTLPMKTWHLALTGPGGCRVGVGRAVLRYAACWIGPALAVGAYLALRPFGLGAHAVWLVAFNFLWAFIDPDRAFLHDRVAGTRIVVDRGGAAGAR